MKTGRIAAGVAAVLIGMATPACFIDIDTVCCEKVYDVKLSADTVDIDINDIPEDRVVKVGINIENNPGFMGLIYNIEYDSRLTHPEHRFIDCDLNRFVTSYGFKGNGNIAEIFMTTYSIGPNFSDNGNILYLFFTLPENLDSGDYFAISFLKSYEGNDMSLSQENSFDSYFGLENFAEPVGGGIRITGEKKQDSPPPETQKPETEVQPSKEPEKPSETPQNGNNSSQNNGGQGGNSSGGSGENKGNGDSNSGQVTGAVTESEVTESYVTSETVVTSEVPVTSPVTSVSETVITVPETEAETGTETAVQSDIPESEKMNNEKTGSLKLVFICLGTALAAVAVSCAGALINRAKKEKKK